MVNPRQAKYQVEGYETVEVAEEPVNVDSSERSLSLKPDRSTFAQGPETPSKTEGSEQESLLQLLKDDEARALEEQRQIPKNAEMKASRDALDDAIAEITALKDLVSRSDIRLTMLKIILAHGFRRRRRRWLRSWRNSG